MEGAEQKRVSRRLAEALEGRPRTEGNPEETTATWTQRQGQALSGLQRIREAARGDKDLRFTNLMHHLDVELLRASYHSLKRNAAVGVGDETWQEYGERLEERITGLHGRVQSGRYRAKPSKRVWIPKTDGRQRPIGISALEDKIVQMAMVWVFNAIYEEEFHGFSYGFRPNRSQHNALDALWVGITQRRINWVLDADIRSFFDSINHELLLKLIERRIGDSRVLRLIHKWLRAGVSEDGKWSKTEVGTPQGAVISPMLSNIYLHYVLDQWVSRWRKREAHGEVIIVRYADDFVMGFQNKYEAERFLKGLKRRLAEYWLELHDEKTRLIQFGRFAEKDRTAEGKGKPETFDFLGFTHICGRTRKNNAFTVRRKTIGKRIRSKIKQVRQEIMRRRHEPVSEQGRWLRSIVQGHLNYYAVPDNYATIHSFCNEIHRAWLFAIRRRSQKSRKLGWDRFKRLIVTWIPKAEIKHLYPNQRLCVSYPR